jgi:hypothetical protein
MHTDMALSPIAILVTCIILQASIADDLSDPYITISFLADESGWQEIHADEDLWIEWEGLNFDASISKCSSLPCPYLLFLIDEHVTKDIHLALQNTTLNMSPNAACSLEPHCLPFGRCCGGAIQFVVFSGPHRVQLALSLTKSTHDIIARSEELSFEISGTVPGFNSKSDPWLSSAAPQSPHNIGTHLQDSPSSPGSTNHGAQLTADGAAAAAAAAGHDSPYSTHACVGVDPAEGPDAVSDGMCLFRNLCAVGGELVYHMHPGIRHEAAARPPRLHAAARRHRWEPREVFELAVRRGPRPAGAARESRLHAYIRRAYPYNHGHVLGDDAWPVFQGMVMFDVLTYDVQVRPDAPRRARRPRLRPGERGGAAPCLLPGAPRRRRSRAPAAGRHRR